jgi:hypothetical protein
MSADDLQSRSTRLSGPKEHNKLETKKLLQGNVFPYSSSDERSAEKGSGGHLVVRPQITGLHSPVTNTFSCSTVRCQ